ncbi:probable acyltransferase [Brucella inopinata BO1]|uniref:O-acetyltransferase n=1 Tax=Brucella phage BiPBO1 TaxID=1718278 RepID=UPI0001E16106|nr:acyltransferase [Brucella inopinata]YP_009304060.1 O-acetyltransferase [Brucella phage BiPBO1]ALJ98246.1 acyltransferase [Brucella phage BiPBO1]EFM55367.1 probable acyltransferase [Brucella inopinata BO1]KEY03706.1 hypothetical protein IL59_0214965 [Brucella suis bv. 4 str. 40]
MQRSGAIDGLRGLAAVAVIYYHAILTDTSLIQRVLYPSIFAVHGTSDILAKVVLTLVNGQSAVILFFALSGFVLNRSLMRAATRFSLPVVAMDFVWKRVWRIMPALFVTIAFCFLISRSWITLNLPGSDLWHFQSAANLHKAVENAFLLKISMHGASWTLQAEMLVVPFIFVAFLLGRFIGVAGLTVSLVYGFFALSTPALAFDLPNIPGTLAAFMAGMLVADDRLISALRMPPHHLIFLGVSFVFLRILADQGAIATTLGQSLLAAILVGATYASDIEGDNLWLLNSKHVRALGRISYSLYLLNVPFLWIMQAISPSLGLQSWGPLVYGLITGTVATVATVPLAIWSERWVEMPAVSLGNRMLSKFTSRSRQRPMEQTANF